MMQTRHVGAYLLPALLVCGCETMSNTEKGVGLGAGIGAATGALIGKATGHTAGGALIGAGVGGLSGGLVGHAVDQSEKKAEAHADAVAAVSAQQVARGPLGLTDVAQMAQQHISDDVIIAQIRTTRSVYHLSSNDIIWLKQQGVSDAVVEEMQRSANRIVPVYSTVAPAPRPVVVVEDPPPAVIYRYRRW